MKITANPFFRSTLLHFSRSRCLSLVLAVAGACAMGNASAAIYTYSNVTTNTAETATLWSAGTGWNAVPQSAVDTTLNFTGTLAAGAAIFTNNDIVGTFVLNRLSFSETGPASGAVPTITLSGNALQFVSNGATTPTIAFGASAGAIKPTVTINNDIIATDALSIGGATDGTINGTISGAGAITKISTGNVFFTHANTYTGLTTVTGGGILVISDALALGGTAQGVNVASGSSLSLSGNITVTGESITIAGLGSGSGGALRNSSGNNTWAGDVILGLGTTSATGNAARIGSVGGNLTVSGVIKDGEAPNLAIRNGDTGGAVILSGQNTYTGTTHFVVGAVTVSSINSVVTNAATGAVHSASSNLGAPTTAANGTLYFSSGTAAPGSLIYTGAGETTDRNIVLAGSTAGATIDQSGATGLLKILGNISAPGAAATDQRKTLTLTGTGLGEIAGVISDAVLGTAGQLSTSLTKSNLGNWTLSGANTFTGKTIITSGSLTVSSLNSVVGGTASSSLGAPTTAANGTINLSAGVGNAQIIYTGTGETTDRILNLGGTTGGGAITQSGTGLLKFTSSLTATGVGSKVFTLQGSTTGTGEIAGAIVDNSSVNKTSLAKAGTGTWTLSGLNTYTGTTAINGGTLILKSGGSLVTASMTVGNATSGNGTLSIVGNYTIGNSTTGAITVRGGTSATGQGTLTLVDDSINTLTLNSAAGTALSLGSTIAGNGTAIVNLELGSGLTSDLIQIGQNLQVNAAGATINLSKVTGSTLSAGTYTLMTYGSGSTFTGAFTLGTTPTLTGQVASYSLTNTGTAQQLVVAIAAQGATAYWNGSQSALWNTINGTSTNFRLNADGTGAEVLPDSTTDVYFAANSATNVSSTLGQDFTIKSLNFNAAATTAYTIGGTNTLTLTNGLSVDASSGNHTINTKVALAGNQTWNLGGTSSQLLTVGGVISGTGNLALTGGRKLVLTGANTFASASIAEGSTLQLGVSTTTGSMTGSVTNNGTLIINRSDNTTFANTITGTGAFIKNGVGTLALTGNNSYSGVTTVSGGILSISTANALGTASNTAGAGVVVETGGILQLSGNVTITGEALSLTAKSSGTNDFGISNLSGNNEWTGNITLLANATNNNRFSSTAGTLTLSGNINASAVSGTNIVVKGAGEIVFSGNVSGNVGIITTSTGTYTFSGNNTFNGFTAFQGGGTIVASSLNSFATNAGLGTVRATSSSLGVATNTGNNVLNFGNGTTSASTGTLKYVGSGETTDRSIVLSGTAGTATLEQSGTGLLKFVGNVTNTANAGAKVLNLAGSTAGNGEISGNIVTGVGTTAVTKNGTNTWTLSGTNTYTGTTTVSGGTLLINGNNSAATGAVSVAFGATLGGRGTVGGATTISGTHAAGASNINDGIGTQTFSSSLSYASGSSFSWDLGSETTEGAGNNFDSVIVNGSMSVDSGSIFKVVVSDLNLNSSFWASNKTWDIFETGDISGTFGTFQLYDASNLLSSISYGNRGVFSFGSNGQLSWSAIPEPSNALAGVLIAAGLLRRRRNAVR